MPSSTRPPVRRFFLFVLLALAGPLSYGLLITALNAETSRWLLQRWLTRTYGSMLDGRIYVERLTAAPILALTVGGQLRTSAIRLDDVTLELHGLALWPARPEPTWVGTLRARRLALDGLELQTVTGGLWRQADGWRLQPFRAHLASGQLAGSLSITDGESAPTVTLQLQLERVPLEALAPLAPALFERAQGTVSGQLTVTSAEEAAPQLAGAFRVEEPGGTVQAEFLKGLLPYVPTGARNAELEGAVARGRPIRFQHTTFQVESTGPDELKALLFMALSEYNMNLDADFTIRVDEVAALPQLQALWNQLVETQ